MMKPAIVLSTHTMGLAVIRSLGIMGVPIVAVHYDPIDIGYVSRYAKEKIHAPHPEKEEDAFIELLMSQASRLAGGILIPASDETLTVVSKHKDLLARHYIVACTGWDITQQFIDKMYTYTLAESIGVPAPKTVIPQSLNHLERNGAAISYPCLIKPRQSHRYDDIFKTKMTVVSNRDELVKAYQQATDAGVEVLVQEIVPGDDSQTFNYNSYFWDGQPLVEFTARQLRKAPPRFGAPRVVISEDVPDIVKPGRAILKAMGFYGFSCTEFKKDSRDGVYKLMEVNGRHNRSALLAVRCGLNFPWFQYQHLVLGKLPSPSRCRTGVYWIMLDKDISYSLRNVCKERYSFLQYLRPYFRPHVFDALDWKDPKPFTLRCIHIVESIITKLFIPKRKHQKRR